MTPMRRFRRTLGVALVSAAMAWMATAPAVAANATGAGESSAVRVQIPVDDSPTLGPDDAPVTIVEFSDFVCPYSAFGTLALRKLVERYPTQVRIVFKHFPLGFNYRGGVAHRAAVVAATHGQFWPMHDLLFRNQRWDSRKVIIGHARDLGMDADAFLEASTAPETRERVARDQALGRSLQVTATPTYFVNGIKVVGAQPPLEWLRMVERELKARRETSARP
jgi:protein-disulfide isomerase